MPGSGPEQYHTHQSARCLPLNAAQDPVEILWRNQQEKISGNIVTNVKTEEENEFYNVTDVRRCH